MRNAEVLYRRRCTGIPIREREPGSVDRPEHTKAVDPVAVPVCNGGQITWFADLPQFGFAILGNRECAGCVVPYRIVGDQRRV